MRHHVVKDRARGDLARPTNHGWHPEAALPVGVLLASEGRDCRVRPSVEVRSIVGAVKNDRVIRDAELIKLIQESADQIVVAHHGVVIKPLTGQALFLFRGVRPKVHAGGVEPNEEGFVVLRGAPNKPLGAVEELEINRLHTLFIERAGVGYPAISKAVHDSAGAKALSKSRVLRVVRILGLFLGV